MIDRNYVPGRHATTDVFGSGKVPAHIKKSFEGIEYITSFTITHEGKATVTTSNVTPLKVSLLVKNVVHSDNMGDEILTQWEKARKHAIAVMSALTLKKYNL